MHGIIHWFVHNPVAANLLMGILLITAAELRAALQRHAGVQDISDTFRAGKQEVQLRLLPQARTLGLTVDDLGRQVRQAFYGYEAQRIQRGKDDIRVMVRYPERERRSRSVTWRICAYAPPKGWRFRSRVSPGPA